MFINRRSSSPNPSTTSIQLVGTVGAYHVVAGTSVNGEARHPVALFAAVDGDFGARTGELIPNTIVVVATAVGFGTWGGANSCSGEGAATIQWRGAEAVVVGRGLCGGDAGKRK